MVEHPLVVPHVKRIDGTQDGVMGLAKLLVLKLLMEAAAATAAPPAPPAE